MKKRFKGQAIVEYALVGALVLAVTLPALQPMANNIGVGVKNSAPKANPKQVVTVAPDAKVGNPWTTSGTTVAYNAGPYVDPNVAPADPADPTTPATTETTTVTVTPTTPSTETTTEITDPSIVAPQKVYMYSSMNAFKWDKDENGDYKSNMGIFKEIKANGINANFGGVLDRLQSDTKDAIDQIVSSNAMDKAIFINEDGSLYGLYSGSEVSALNGDFLWNGEELEKYLVNPDTFKSIGSMETGFGTKILKFDTIDSTTHTVMYYTSGRNITLPDGTEVFVENNAVYSPIVFDLNGDGIKTTENLIKYDLNGDGKKDTIHDIKDDGILCIRGGKSGLDLFGDNTDLNNDGKRDGFKNGFEALKSLARTEKLIDDKDDMKLDEKDIQVLDKKHGLSLKIGYLGKVKTLKSLGVTEITLPRTEKVGVLQNFDGKGNILMMQDGATIKINGKTNIFADVWHKVTEMAKKVVNSITSLFK